MPRILPVLVAIAVIIHDRNALVTPEEDALAAARPEELRIRRTDGLELRNVREPVVLPVAVEVDVALDRPRILPEEVL